MGLASQIQPETLVQTVGLTGKCIEFGGSSIVKSYDGGWGWRPLLPKSLA